MKEIGINKLLYDKRIELGYSKKEACIRLDISKLKLDLIENGYIKVKDKKLQDKFIFKYKLHEDFFKKETLEYPSPLEDDKKEDISGSIIVKIFKKLWFKISMIIVSLGFVVLASYGMSSSYNIDYSSFFSEKYNSALKYANENGKDYLAINSKTSEMLLSNYKAIEDEDKSLAYGFDYRSINFFPKYKEYTGFAFFNFRSVVNLKDITGLDYGEKNEQVVYYESRVNGTTERLHFYSYLGSSILSTQTSHISVDYDYNTMKFTYNLIEIINYDGRLEKDDGNSLIAGLARLAFESKFLDFENAKEKFIQDNKNILHYDSLEEFNADQSAGLNKSYSYINRSNVITILGVVFTTLFFAIFVLSIIVTTTVGKKVMKAITIEEDTTSSEPVKKEPKPLPKNKFPMPIIPECAIRIIAFFLMVIGSMSIYFIFNSIINGDIVGTLESLQYRAVVAAFTTIGMILIFFIKMDIIQNKKNAFMLNYILFFAGFIFYIFTLVINVLINNSPALQRFSIILDLLPGNIVWGILAFNLLTTILLRKPKFEKHVKRNTIIYRLTALIPLGYMIASTIIQIGKKALGWQLPFAVSSLFFTKALIITAFTILYCLIIFIYKKIVEHKFGKENAETYMLGNRYQYIKNFLVVLIFIILGVTDLLIGKTEFGAKIGFGSNIGLLYFIPVILLYHPHRGPRNKKWDLVFNIAYGFSMLIGVISILASVSIYLTSL